GAAGAHRERHLAEEEQRRAPEENSGARLVEAALEHREGRNREASQAAHGELAEDEQEAGAEVRHAPAFLDDGAGCHKRRGADVRGDIRAAAALQRAMISARRFLARPSAVLLSAMGLLFPKPCTE